MTRTWPSKPTITLSGLKSRWTSPFSWAADQTAACVGEDLQDLGPGAFAGRHPVAQRVALDELHGDEDCSPMVPTS